ncbi:fluoride efflux transporter FluC [Ureibacillus sp. NPDC094379]
MYNWIQVFLGGMVGATLRFYVQTITTTSISLWIVNILGSFLLGSLNGYYNRKNADISYKLFFTTGLLGAFTTFSAFSQHWFFLLQESVWIGVLYGITMTLVCVLVAFFGFRIFRGERKWNG